jgi:MFS family permease
MLFSRIHGPITFYAAFFVISAGANMTGFPTTFAIVHWFERRRSTALSLAGFGNSLGGIAFVLVAFLLAKLGWRETAFISGIALLVIGLPIAQVFHHRPSDIGLEVDGGPPTVQATQADATAVRGVRVDFTLRQAMRHPSFWWISLGHASALFVVGAVNVHLVSYLTQTHGYSLAQASGIVLLMTLMFGVGTLSGGFIGDRANRQTSSMVCMVMHMAGMLLLAYAVSGWMIFAFALIHGYAWGWRGPQMAALRADYFGPTAFGRIMGVSNIVVTMGNMAGPLIAGYVYDQTGSYRIGFNILAAIAAFGSAFFYLAKRPAPLEQHPNPAPVP